MVWVGSSQVGTCRIITVAWLASIVLCCAPAAAAPTPSPSAVVLGGVPHVYYVGGDGQIRQLTHSGSSWVDQDLAAFVSGAEPAAAGSSPSVLVDRGGDQHVYYVGANGQVWQYVWDGSHWTIQEVAGFVSGAEPAAAGSSPSVLLDPGGDQHVYYVGANGQVWQYVWDGSHWTIQEVAGFVSGAEPAAAGSSPAVLVDPGGDQHVYYVGANGQVWQYVWDGSHWFIQDLASFASSHEGIQAGGSPDAVVAGSNQHVWYVGANGRVWQWLWNGSSWADQDLGGFPWTPPPAPAPQVTTGSTTISAPPRPRRVHALLRLSWRWRGAHTRVRRLTGLQMPQGRRFTIRCSGRGCPAGIRSRHARHSLRALDGLVFRAGDRLEITVFAPGLILERFVLRFRSRHGPTGRVL
jgi:hypothetical protein